MLEIYIDHDQDFSFAMFVIDEKSSKKVLSHIIKNFGYTLEKTDDDVESFGDTGDFLSNTLLIKYKDVSEDFLEIASKINLYIVS